MLSTLVNLQLAEQLTTQGVVGKHAFDGFLHDPLRDPGLQVGEGLGLHATGPAGVAAVNLLGRLVTAHLHLVGVDDDDKVAGVEVGGVAGLVLAAQHLGHFARQATEGLILCVHQIPLAFEGINGGQGGLVHFA